MGIITPELSKLVGWEHSIILEYPSVAEVINASDYALLLWYRFLTSPRTSFETKIINLIAERINLKKEA